MVTILEELKDTIQDQNQHLSFDVPRQRTKSVFIGDRDIVIESPEIKDIDNKKEEVCNL